MRIALPEHKSTIQKYQESFRWWVSSHLVLDARNNRVAYAILSFGGFLGVGDRHFAIPWEALSFDLSQKIAALTIDEDRLRNAPGFEKDSCPDMADPSWGSQIYRQYGYEPYWEETTGQTPQTR